MVKKDICRFSSADKSKTLKFSTEDSLREKQESQEFDMEIKESWAQVK